MGAHLGAGSRGGLGLSGLELLLHLQQLMAQRLILLLLAGIVLRRQHDLLRDLLHRKEGLASDQKANCKNTGEGLALLES